MFHDHQRLFQSTAEYGVRRRATENVWELDKFLTRKKNNGPISFCAFLFATYRRIFFFTCFKDWPCCANSITLKISRLFDQKTSSTSFRSKKFFEYFLWNWGVVSTPLTYGDKLDKGCSAHALRQLRSEIKKKGTPR